MSVVSMNYLLEAGVQFGHQKRRWNPKMKQYIYTLGMTSILSIYKKQLSA